MPQASEADLAFECFCSFPLAVAYLVPDLTIFRKTCIISWYCGNVLETMKNRSGYIIFIHVHYSFVLLSCHIGYSFGWFRYFSISTFPGFPCLSSCRFCAIFSLVSGLKNDWTSSGLKIQHFYSSLKGRLCRSTLQIKTSLSEFMRQEGWSPRDI